MTIYSSSSSSACSELLQSFQRAMKSVVYSNEYLLPLLLRLLNNCIGRVTHYMRCDRGVISCGKTLFRRLEENNTGLYGNIIASPHSISAYVSHTGHYSTSQGGHGTLHWGYLIGVMSFDKSISKQETTMKLLRNTRYYKIRSYLLPC